MTRDRTPAPLLGLLLALITSWCSVAGAAPRVFWVSDPVRPDETVLLQGSGLAGASVEMARLEDAAASGPGDAAATITKWTPVPVLQGDEQSLTFVVPATWTMGVFACRVSAGGTTSEPVLVNAPDPWWAQGDEGQSASPGGWLRVMGKSLRPGPRPAVVRLVGQGAAVVLRPVAADGYCLRCEVPKDLKAGAYAVWVHNGCGGDAAWRQAGTIAVKPAPAAPQRVYSVLEVYGPDAVKKMRGTLVKYTQPLDRTEGIQAALKQAKQNGGGIVYFPAGRYRVTGPLVIPEHTILRGEGMGLVTLWWGRGHFNLDGGGPQGRAKVDEPAPPDTLIYGPDFEIEQMSLYLPLAYRLGIVADRRLRMRKVRVRIDHYWLVQGRGDGAVARLGRNFSVTDCDILAKGDGLVPGAYGVIARNRILSNKCNTPMGGSRNLIVEDNDFVSMDPTTYQNISGSGRNIYYAHNHQQSLYAQQADYSFTFDAGTGAYLGAVTQQGTTITLAGDPVYPKWALETSSLWRRACVCILDGHGAGQWRDVVANRGRSWEIDRAFDPAPDATSIVSIVPFNGRVLIIGNRFEDANWVNAGYGTSIDVVCAENTLLRCADLMNYGVRTDEFFEPSWHVQYFDNQVTEGQTQVGSSGGGHRSQRYTGPLTCWAVHRRHTIAADNSGSISIGGNLRDVIVEGCVLKNTMSAVKVDKEARGVLLRKNTFEGTPSPRYMGEGIKGALADGTAPAPGPAEAAPVPEAEGIRKSVRVPGRAINIQTDCGARGDGRTNDTGAFQKAAELIRKQGGGRLIIPAGTYIVGEQHHEAGKFPYYLTSAIFAVRDVDGLIIEGEPGAVLKLADGVHYGSFDKATGKRIDPPPPFYDRDCHVTAGVMLNISNSSHVIIRNLELNGNREHLTLGGPWGDTGYQLAAGGIHLFGCREVLVENVHTHHQGQDGLMIGFPGLKATDPPTPHVLVNVTSEYNGRQGLSWVGGRGLTAVNCRFNHTQRDGFGSAPGAGVDIEAEDSVCRDGAFRSCEFINNGGCGLAADSGDGGYTRFEDCTFWGTTNWAIWNTKPGMVFENCRFYGSIVHAFGSSEHPELATQYRRCHFEDREHPKYGVYRSAVLVNQDHIGDNVTFDDCDIIASRIKGFWIENKPGTQAVLRNCRITHKDPAVRDGDFQSLFRGTRLEDVHFMEAFGPDVRRRYYILAQGVTLKGEVRVDGPRVKWGNPKSGAVGVIKP